MLKISAKSEQLLAFVVKGLSHIKGGKLRQEREARGWGDKENHCICISVYMCVVVCYLRITLLCV